MNFFILMRERLTCFFIFGHIFRPCDLGFVSFKFRPSISILLIEEKLVLIVFLKCFGQFSFNSEAKSDEKWRNFRHLNDTYRGIKLIGVASDKYILN